MIICRNTLLIFACLTSFALGQLPAGDSELLLDYSQWKFAAGDGKLLEPIRLSAKPGFQVEVVRVAEKGEGSWISLAFDPRGGLLVGREDKGILRFKFGANAEMVDFVESIDDTLLEPRGLLIVHGSLYVTANNMQGLYRLRQATSGGYGPPELLQQFEGGVGHGRNGLALGPDGKIYLACGNNVKIPREWNLTNSPYRNFGQDRLLPCEWNEFLFDGDVAPPCGFVARCDSGGQNWELIAGGFRNPYDLAFNRDGELFTYDADMEWDVGAPWYRPTTVMHVVPGGEYGWRQGTNVWPDHFPDALPRVVDVGLGSPTGVAFGEKSNFPAPYPNAMFILDWAYGRILAVHVAPEGASYRGKVETFLRGKPLNVTDLTFGPDGAMYFSVGGRGTKSAVYRVKWTGEVNEPQPARENEQGSSIRELRRTLEASSEVTDHAISAALDTVDPFLRSAALVAAQSRPSGVFRPTTQVGIQTLRFAKLRESQHEATQDPSQTIARAIQQANSHAEKIVALRATQLALIRHHAAASENKAAICTALESQFPATSWPENQMLMELLVFLQSSHVVERALPLIEKAENDQQRIFYLYALRLAENGWTLGRRKEYLKWLKASEKFPGAHYLPRILTYIRTDALARFTEEERAVLASEIERLGHYPEAEVPPARPEINKWTVENLAAAVRVIKRPADLIQGEKLYAGAQCIRCHRHGERGVPFGPDLQHVSARFGAGEILEAIVEPSRVIDDKYQTMTLETSSGLTATGFLVGGNAETFFVAQDPLRPTAFKRIPRKEIINRTRSPLSPMPAGLLNGLTADEIYDLLAYLGISASK